MIINLAFANEKKKKKKLGIDFFFPSLRLKPKKQGETDAVT